MKRDEQDIIKYNVHINSPSPSVNFYETPITVTSKMSTRIFPNNFRINRFESKVNFESVLGSFHAFHEFLPDHLKNGQSGNRATADLCNLKKVRLFKRLLPSRISWWPAGVSCRQGSTKRHRRRAARWW